MKKCFFVICFLCFVFLNSPIYAETLQKILESSTKDTMLIIVVNPTERTIKSANPKRIKIDRDALASPGGVLVIPTANSTLLRLENIEEKNGHFAVISSVYKSSYLDRGKCVYFQNLSISELVPMYRIFAVCGNRECEYLLSYKGYDKTPENEYLESDLNCGTYLCKSNAYSYPHYPKIKLNTDRSFIFRVVFEDDIGYLSGVFTKTNSRLVFFVNSTTFKNSGDSKIKKITFKIKDGGFALEGPRIGSVSPGEVFLPER